MNNYQILNGNELLIQGGLEAGFNLYTGYPGSPLADFFNILYQRKKEFSDKGIRVVIANSEANAAAMASGAKMAGQNVLIGMKSMGLHVASDALSVGNFALPIKANTQGEYPGVVIAVGDDPWSISTSTPADSRYLFKHLHIPFLEPSTPQELKDWMKIALELSQKSSIYVGILLTTYMAEGGGRVQVGESAETNGELVELDPADFDLSQNVMVPPNSLKADERMIRERFPKYQNILSTYNLDRSFGNLTSKVGIISTGATFEVLKQVLEESELIDQVSLYKSASSYALNASQLLSFCENKQDLIIVEEKRGFLENEIRGVLSQSDLKPRVFGKQFTVGESIVEGFPAFGGLSYEIIYKKINQILDLIENDEVHCKKMNDVNLISLGIDLPKRLPTFCPGCPHRETLSIMKEIRGVLKDKDINLISHGDVGCYSLSFLEPFKEMHDLSAMGQGGALGAGADLFLENPSVVLMGDSTFFHSGMNAISNSVQMGHHITYILLDNDNTAMTGHQMTPTSGLSVDGIKRPKQKMLEVARSLQVSKAIEVNPSDRYFYRNLLEDLVQASGVKVIVSNKECGLTFHGRKKASERKLFASGEVQPKREFYQINTFACEDCRACVEMTGCPGLGQTFDGYGSKVMIDPQICVADSYCTKIKACPSFELVEVSQYHPTLYQKNKNTNEAAALMQEPTPKVSLDQIADGVNFNIVVIGVGGSGVTTISRILAEAAKNMDAKIDFKFVDQKGLAQRNGSVSSHLSFFSRIKSHGQITPVGSADLLLSPDLLEGARAVNFLAQDGVAIIDNNYQIPLSLLLESGIEKDLVTEDDLRNELQKKINTSLELVSFKEISYELFNRSVYASSMLLGFTFQKGLLPFALSSLELAIENAVPKAEVANNLKAFTKGRELAELKMQTAGSQDQEFSEADYLESMLFSIYPWQSPKRFKGLFKTYLLQFQTHFPELKQVHLAQYLHDLFVYDQGQNIAQLFEDFKILKEKYNQKEFIIAAATLVKNYWIKDEVFVSHQMISPLKMKRDRKMYAQLGTEFKVRHINRPAFDVFGKKIEFDLSPRRWMFSIMRHLRILRILLPSWHKREKEISLRIRTELLSGLEQHQNKYQRIKELASIKGYREIRYAKAKEYLK
jgi:indolepyruvate ferredoxin oxidoreductase